MTPNQRTQALADLAARMGLRPADAIALPTVIEVAARKMGISFVAMINEAKASPELCDYLGDCCVAVMASPAGRSV